MHGAVPALSVHLHGMVPNEAQYVLMACYLVKHRESFPFFVLHSFQYQHKVVQIKDTNTTDDSCT